MRLNSGIPLIYLAWVLTASAADPPSGALVEYQGLCNASAAVALGGGHFIVADDEDSPKTFLRVYRTGQAAVPVASRLVPNGAMDLDPNEDLEVDLEGAARIGDRIYWIGSHSASKSGKSRPNRRRLFATRVDSIDSQDELKVVGKPYKKLVADLEDDPAYTTFDLKKAGKIAPKEAGGLSIEGLAASPDGDLLIGFRNPVPEGKALIATLKNPKGVTEGKAAKFAAPILLDLKKLGIRSLEWSESLHAYLIVGGTPDAGGGSRLFRWSGDPTEQPKRIPGIGLGDLNPEALFVEQGTVTVLSDDGRRQIAGEERDCAAPGVSKSFRGIQILLPTP